MAEEQAHLSRREMRAHERAASDAYPDADDLLAAEMERQLAPFRTPEALNPSDDVAGSEPEASQPAPVIEAHSEPTRVVEPEPASESVSEPALISEPVAAPVATKEHVAPHKPKKARKSAPPASPVVPAKLISNPQVSAPRQRSGTKSAARVFSFVAMFFVLALALATSIPAIALMSPEQRAYQAEMDRIKLAAQAGDPQTLLTAGGAATTTARDGVAIGGAVQSSNVNYVGAYSDKKLKVTVPISTNPIKWPFPSGLRVTDHFGYRNIFGSTSFHTGQDFDMAYGTTIHAIADGIVTYIENPGFMCGTSVTIDSNINGNKFSTVYCHMVTGSIPLTLNQSISAGDVVGQVGLTGITTGPHLHLEVRVNDVPIDPWPFLIQYAGNPPY